MKTFDCAAAWRELAKPAYLALPQAVCDLFSRVADETEGMHQNHDLEGDLKKKFEAVPSADLAWAAHVIYYVGQWFPSRGKLDLPGRDHGAHRKFSIYADQVLRTRLDLKRKPPYADNGLTFDVHEGVIRICWSSKNMWTGREVAPATEGGLGRAQEIRRDLEEKLSVIPERNVHRRDNLVYTLFDDLKKTVKFAPPWDRMMNTEGYMVEEGDERPDPDVDYAAEAARERLELRQRLVDEATKKKAKIDEELEGMLWFIDHEIPIDNLIFYDHTKVWTFGWRRPVGPELLKRILEVISEFPGAYCIKTYDGRQLEGYAE